MDGFSLQAVLAHPHALWIWFAIATIGFIGLDFVQMRKQGDKGIALKDALRWSAMWIGIAVFFALSSWWLAGFQADPAIPRNEQLGLWFTGYLIEKALAVDNVFVFLMVFTILNIPSIAQKRLLMWGVMGAIVLRLIMIFLASALIATFQWVLVLFGIFLVVMGWRTWPVSSHEEEEESSGVITWIRKHVEVRDANGYAGKDPLARRGFYITTSLLALLTISVVDIVFAVDSIPAIFAVTTDTWIVASSNVFAVLGLRPMYFLLKHMRDKLVYLPHALSIILVAIGAKLLVLPWFHVPIAASLGFIVFVLAAAAAGSYYKTRQEVPPAQS